MTRSQNTDPDPSTTDQETEDLVEEEEDAVEQQNQDQEQNKEQEEDPVYGSLIIDLVGRTGQFQVSLRPAKLHMQVLPIPCCCEPVLTNAPSWDRHPQRLLLETKANQKTLK